MNCIPKALTLPPRTVFGPGSAKTLLTECARHGSRGILVHGRSVAESGALQRILSSEPAGLQPATWQHPGGEPTLDQLRQLLAFARSHDALWIAAVGGGSTLDLGKACAGLLMATGELAAFHDGKLPLPESRTPFLAAPTTAGTGTEATIVSVLSNSATGVKKSIRHASHMAHLVILDPDLLASCPPSVIAASGMDAFTQAFESFISRGATWLTDSLSMKAMELVASHLEPFHAGKGAGHAAAVLQGSYLAGIALSNARLGLVHGLAHPLGARFHTAHGLVCAVCLPSVIEFNRAVSAEKYDRITAQLGSDPGTLVQHLNRVLGIQSPFTGRRLYNLKEVVTEALASGSTAANPREVTAADVETVLAQIFA
jgi:alcohol dehydrogenase class IV